MTCTPRPFCKIGEDVTGGTRLNSYPIPGTDRYRVCIYMTLTDGRENETSFVIDEASAPLLIKLIKESDARNG